MSNPLRRREFLQTSSGILLAGPSLLSAASHSCAGEAQATLLAGAAEVDISPRKLPVLASGGFLERQGTELRDPLFARGLVLNDGRTRIAIVVVDTLMMPREMLDEVKNKAAASTGIPTQNMLISATHTHSAPSVLGALGTGVDEDYAAFLPGKIVECIEKAAATMEPALAGADSVIDREDTNCRVWFRRPDRIGEDPFGNKTIRAMMHPGYQNPDYLGPCGPEDPELSVLSVVRENGSPLAVLANYSMHYFGAAPVSSDYFGLFAKMVREDLSKEAGGKPCIAMMSHGTSGDQHWMDYSQPRKSIDIKTYARRVADRAIEAFKKTRHTKRVPLNVAETRLTLERRLPDKERETWARQIIEAMGDRTKPANRPEVYAREQMYLLEEPERELKLQVLQIDDLVITAIPCEVYAITGLKLKMQTPYAKTMNIELANGAEGYIPPPELHTFGGYNTWPARSAGLETEAEPKIVETLLNLTGKLCGCSPNEFPETTGPSVKAVLEEKPIAYWPLDNIVGTKAEDCSSNNRHATYEPGVAYFLEGPQVPGLSRPDGPTRAAHFAGGRVAASCPLCETYSVEMWIYNCLPNDARAVTGYFFSRGADGSKGAPGEHLGIGGTYRDGSLVGRLIFFNGDERNEVVVGSTEIAPKKWHHVALVRQGEGVKVFLNGQTTPELEGQVAPGCSTDETSVFIGGRSDNLFNFEGKICQVAVFDHVLDPEQIAAHHAVAVRQGSSIVADTSI